MQVNDILLLSLKTLKPWKLYCLYRFTDSTLNADQMDPENKAS